MRVAAIDVGTNSIHLLVAEVHPDGRMDLVEKAREQVMLGSGGIGQRRIAPDAFARGLDCLTRFVSVAESLGCVDIHAAATSAVREASNGLEFCRAVKEATGVHIRVISGSDEGHLIYQGVKDDLDFTHGRVLIFDLGGGSTEFILCDPDEALHIQSLPLGHIRLTDTFLDGAPFGHDARKAIKKHVRQALGSLLQRVPPTQVGSLVGTSGTIRCLARMATLARGDVLPAHAQGLVLHRRELEDLIERMVSLTPDELCELPGMDARRRDTLPAGAVLVREVMKAFGVSSLSTSTRSLRNGLIVDWVRRNRPEIDLSETIEDPRERSIALAMRQFGVHHKHAHHVTAFALDLFDATAARHHLPVTDRDILRAASLLHDIGHHIAGKGHHKHGQYLLEHIRMFGWTAPEVALIANVVRYHSRSTPKSSHPGWASLSKEDQRRVAVMAGCLRIADALDRSHNQPVRRLAIQLDGDVLRLHAHLDEGGDLERWAVDRRRDMLEKALRVTVQVTIETAADAEEAAS